MSGQSLFALTISSKNEGETLLELEVFAGQEKVELSMIEVRQLSWTRGRDHDAF